MSDDWEPKYYSDDTTANAILNVAAAIDRLASATSGLLYGLKYSKETGTSIAEAIENAGEKIANSASCLSDVARAIDEHG